MNVGANTNMVEVMKFFFIKLKSSWAILSSWFN